MKNYRIQSIFLALGLSFSFLCLHAENSASIIQNRLIDEGFENVRVVCNNHHISATIEDNHYRGIFRGLAVALQKISPDASANDTIHLIALDRQMPKMTIDAIHANGEWQVESYYGGKIDKALSKAKSKESSAFKIDVVAYPQINLSNSKDRYDRLWCVYSYISPAIEMQLWKGSYLTAQVKLPIWNNYNFGDYDYNKVIPGYVTLSQQILSTNHWDASAVAGIFDDYRDGIIIKGNYHVNNKLDIGINAGYTGTWVMDGNKPDFKKPESLYLLGHINYYEPFTKLQFEIQGGQFLYEDKGVRLDINRHYKDHAIGGYCSITDWGTNVGFDFSIPIGRKKMGKHKTFRLRLPETYAYSFNENTNVKEGHDSNNIGQILLSAPDDNHSAHYWQPEFISHYIKLYLNNSIK